MRIEHGKVGHDDRYWQSYREDTCNGADGTDEHSNIRLGRHVPIPDCRHGYNGPPQSNWDRLEVVFRVDLNTLGVKDERREDDDTENKEEDEEAELMGTGFERVNEDLESGRMTCQLEEAHDADDAEEFEDVVVDVHVVEDAVKDERQRRDDVNDVHRSTDEVQTRRTDNHSNENLERKPRVADRFHVEEGLVRLGRFVDQLPSSLIGRHLLSLVGDHRNAQVGMCLEAERQDRHNNEEYGNERQNLKQSHKDQTVVYQQH